MYPSPAGQREQEDCPIFRIIRVPPSRNKFFQPLRGYFHGDYFTHIRLLVLTMTSMSGPRHGANVYLYLDAAPHRTRFHDCFLVERWDGEAALCQKAQAWLRALHPLPGDALSLLIDDSRKRSGAK